jgi:hypothetical protein
MVSSNQNSDTTTYGVEHLLESRSNSRMLGSPSHSATDNAVKPLSISRLGVASFSSSSLIRTTSDSRTAHDNGV